MSFELTSSRFHQSATLARPRHGLQASRPARALQLRTQATAPKPSDKNNKGFVRQNPVPYHQLEQLLKDLEARGVQDQGISSHKPQEASQKLMKVGNHLLNLEKELSYTPVIGAKSVHQRIKKASLVIYKEVPLKGSVKDPVSGESYTTTSPKTEILREIQEPQGRFSDLHQTMKIWNTLTHTISHGEKPWNPVHLIHGLTSAMVFVSKPDRFNISQKTKDFAQCVQNHLRGMGLFKASPEEKQELLDASTPYGFHVEEDKSDFADYSKKVFRMLSQTVETLKDLEQEGQHDLKVGIAYQTGKNEEAIHDVTDIFPGCNMELLRKPDQSDRDRLENLFKSQDDSK